MRRRLLLVAGLLLAAMLISACSTRSVSDTAPSGGETILIGGVGPLSQPGSVQAGKEMKWAMERAVADINAAGGVLGKQLQLVFYDTQNQPDVAASVARKLVDADKVVAVVGEYHSGAGLAQIPTYNQAGIPAIFSETWNDKITGGDPDNPSEYPANPPTIFRIAPTSTYANEFTADWLVNGIKAKKVVQLYEATDFGIGQAETLKQQLDAAGVELIQVQVELNQPDYSAILARLANEHDDADVAIYNLTGESSYVMVQNAAETGLNDEDTICFTNQVAQDDAAFWRAAPDGTGCVFTLVGLAPGQYNELAQGLVKNFEAEFGTIPKVWVFESYDSVWLVADAIKRAGSADPAAITAALEQTRFTGTQGTYEFPYNARNPLPAGQPSWMWHQWPNPPLQLLQYYRQGQSLAEAAVIWPPARQTHGAAYVQP